MFSLIAIPIGLTLGALAWAIGRGKGGFRGLLAHLALTVAGAVVGGFGAGAMLGLQNQGAIGIGALVGGLVFMAVETLAFRRPRRTRSDQASSSPVR